MLELLGFVFLLWACFFLGGLVIAALLAAMFRLQDKARQARMAAMKARVWREEWLRPF